jgi:hypothetical protein
MKPSFTISQISDISNHIDRLLNTSEPLPGHTWASLLANYQKLQVRLYDSRGNPLPRLEIDLPSSKLRVGGPGKSTD